MKNSEVRRLSSTLISGQETALRVSIQNSLISIMDFCIEFCPNVMMVGEVFFSSTQHVRDLYASTQLVAVETVGC